MLVWIDWVILALLGVSLLIGVWRGFVRESFSLLTWVGAVVAVVLFGEALAQNLSGLIDEPMLRLILAVLILFLGVLIFGAVLSALATHLVSQVGLSGADRVVGVFFGAVRGVVVVALAVFLAGLTTLPKQSVWQESLLVPYFQILAEEAATAFPPNALPKFDYESEPGD